LGNNQGNFQLHRFTTDENIAKSFMEGATFFDSYCIVRIQHLTDVRRDYISSSLLWPYYCLQQ